MIDRPAYLNQLFRAVRRSPITALVGPRQCGKTTLARMFAKERTTTFFDLKSQLDLNRLQNPQLMLGSLRGLVIIDEIQAMPDLFRVLRVPSPFKADIRLAYEEYCHPTQAASLSAA
jgi:predicted AAA+ superfamily ATPase